MDLDNWIAFGSLLISVSSMFYTRTLDKRLGRQQIQINGQILSQNKKSEENEKKAQICANTFKIDKGWRIRVFNNGESPARNIRLYSEDINKENSGISVRIETEVYPLLNKGDHFDLIMVLFEGHNPAPIVKFVWDDEFGKDRYREQTLNLTF